MKAAKYWDFAMRAMLNPTGPESAALDAAHGRFDSDLPPTRAQLESALDEVIAEVDGVPVDAPLTQLRQWHAHLLAASVVAAESPDVAPGLFRVEVKAVLDEMAVTIREGA